MKNVAGLRAVIFLEGISFVVLLLVAMPMKYFFDLPLAVRVAGGVHGLLFLAFGLSVYRAHIECEWHPSRLGLLVLMSLVPGSFFWMDTRIVEWAQPEAEL